MMKISDPIMFGHCVAEYFTDALQKHAQVLAEIGANVNNGLADVLTKLDQLPAGEKHWRSKLTSQLVTRIVPVLAMVWIRVRAGPTCMFLQRRHNRRIDAGAHPRWRQDVEQRGWGCKTPLP